MAGDIPTGLFNLELGPSFNDSKRNGPKYHALRYDFKPKSASNNTNTFIATGGNNDVHVAVPTDGDNMTVYKGSKKEAKPKECLLFFNKETGTVRLEKISSNINVKQTRDVDKPTENVLRAEISKLRAASSSSKHLSASSKDSTSSSSSSNSSDSSDSEDQHTTNIIRQRSSSSSSMSDMETQLLASVNGPTDTTAAVLPLDDMPLFEPPRAMQNARNHVNVESSNHESLGLNLSESSDEED